jgi:hypothetical protein
MNPAPLYYSVIVKEPLSLLDFPFLKPSPLFKVHLFLFSSITAYTHHLGQRKMRPIPFLSLAIAPLLSVTHAAPSGLDTRASCPTNPCGGYNALLEYCGNYNTVDPSPEQLVGLAAMDCMCGFEGAKGIGLWDGTTMDEGFLFVNQCYSCKQGTGPEFTLLTRWEWACNTLLNVGPQQAQTCFNENQYCDTLIVLEKRARI